MRGRRAGRNPELSRNREGEFLPLTGAQSRELARRVRDLKDRRRFLLAAALSAKHPLFYNVSDDTFVMDDATGATLFKRRSAAEAIRTHLSSGVQILQCRVSRKGRLVIRSVPRVRGSVVP